MRLQYNVLLAIIGSILFFSCKKYLEEKSDKHLVIPTSLQDLQSILNGDFKLNSNYPVGGEIGSDNYFLNDADWNGLSSQEVKNLYLWDKNIANESDWKYSYDQIFHCNIVLDNIEKMAKTPANEAQWNQIKGTALFFRANCFYQLAQTYTMPFDSATSGQYEGVPLRLNPDINELTVRPALPLTYNQVLSDLTQSLQLLPVSPAFKTQPGKATVFAALARIYLVLHDYPKAGKYADSSLQINNTLIDYNSLSLTATTPFARFNAEVIFHCASLAATSLNPSIARVDTTLYNSYDSNDLRKTIFFAKNANGTYKFKGSYSGSNTSALFAGVATDEMYLTKAECFARAGNTAQAMNDLNDLMLKRWKKGKFQPLVAASGTEALQLILQERRKELCFRGGLRWIDLRRLNADPVFGNKLQRKINGALYELPVADNRYACLIPQSVITISGINQNAR